jgi:hypothetical protein
MVQARADCSLYSTMDRATTESAHLRYTGDIAATVAELRSRHRADTGRDATVAALPHGQLSVPAISQGASYVIR